MSIPFIINIYQTLIILENKNAVITEKGYDRYWVSIDGGKISVGKGDPSENKILVWKDENPSKGIKYVGFGSWNTPVFVKNIKIRDKFTSEKKLAKRFDPMKTFGSWHNNRTFADVIFKSSTQNIYAHKVILHCASDVFASIVSVPSKMLYDNMEVYEIPKELNDKIFLQILEYIYTGFIGLTIENILEITKWAEYFNLKDLVELCLNFVMYEKDTKSSKLNERHKINFYEMFGNDAYSDLIVEVRDENEETLSSFKCHRIILSMSSEPILLALTSSMKEATEKRIIIKDNPKLFAYLLEYIYKEKIEVICSLTIDEIISSLKLSDRYLIFPFRSYLSKELVRRLDIHNASHILSLATFYSIPYLYNQTLNFIIKNFKELISSETFFDFDASSLANIIFDDNLALDSEIDLFNALMNWKKGKDSDIELRKEDLKQLLSFVRYSLLTVDQLKYILENNEIIKETPYLEELIKSNIELKSKRNISITNLLHTTKRKASALELLFSHPGDENGVLYWISTKGGLERWSNPHKSGRIKVSCSTPQSRFTKLEAVANRTYITVNYASGKRDNPAWWAIDLGENYRLICNHYTFQLDGSRNAVTDWTFQGSNDNSTWTDLKVHEKELKLKTQRGGSVFSWPVEIDNQEPPGYRYFRFIVTGDSVYSEHKFSLCGLELYGYLSFM